ncbi:MAG: hypothetical protein RRZ83_04730 [Alistipes sp.]
MKRYIALLLLGIYLFAVGSPTYATLTCQCITESYAHGCCEHCGHVEDVSDGQTMLQAPCCSDNHSLDIELYTDASQDAARHARRVFIAELPSALVADAIVSVEYTLPMVCGLVVDRYSSSVPDVHVSSCGLRAPPVLA